MKLLKMPPPIKAVIIAVLFASLGLSLSAATECVWVGGESGDISDKTNWDPQVVPSSKSTTAYIAVFTNSVTLSNTESYWYPAGVRVSGNSTVVCNGNSTNNRIMACEVCENDEMVIDVETGSSLTFAKTASNSIFYGQGHLTLVKRGGGDFVSAYWLGQTQYPFKEIELEGGTISGTKNRTVVTDRIHICSGTVLQAGCSNFAGNTDVVVPVIDVEAGGLFDCNGLAQQVASLTGAGVVSNLTTKTLTVNLTKTADAFTGKIYGALAVKALAGSTVPGSNLVIGSADALADASFSITDVAGVPAGVVFSPGIGTFYAKGFPSDRVFYDTEGVPVTLLKPGKSWYVDCKRTGEPGDGKSPETAFQTLAEASTNAALAAYDTIFVAPGVYSNGVVEVVQNNITTFNRVTVPVNVRLVATGSKEETIILGAESPNPVDNCYGDGEGAVRCAWLAAYATLRGFTLTGGHVYCTAKDNPTTACSLGGGMFGDAESSTVIDCVISNNVAVRGGGVQKGRFINCLLLDNRCTQIAASAADKCHFYNCILAGGKGGYEWYGAGVGTAVNCTFGVNGTGSVRGTGTSDSTRVNLYNCVLLSAPSQGNKDHEADAAAFHNCLIARRGSATDIIIDDDCVVTNLTDEADLLEFAGLGADLRPASIRSRVVDTASLDYYTNNFPVANYAESVVDLDGQARVMNGRLDLGAYEFDTTLTRVVVKVAADGMDATGIVPGETVVLATGEKLTYTLARNFRSARLCTGFTVNGTFYDFDDYPNGWTHTVTGSGYAADETVEAVYAEKSDWYIDPEDGNDGNPGYHRLCPKKTFAEVMDCASKGETVWALPGVYSNGTMNCAANQDARVVVKENVTLAAFGSREETIIEGAPAAPENEVAYGCGTGAVRCVYLRTGAKIKGFTIRNGYTFCYLNKDGAPKAGNNGGGIMGMKDQSTCLVSAEDCLVTNCWAVRGGGMAGGVACTRCEFRGNGATDLGGAANYCFFTNCLFGGNVRGSYVTLYCRSIVNCTFLSDNEGDCVHQQTADASPNHVVNCVIMSSPKNLPEYTRCVFNADKKIDDDKMGEGSFKLSLDEFKVDAMGRPLAGSPLVDAALSSAYPNAANDVDFDGSQRVYNAKLDIGAFEYDWRGDFAKKIKRSRKFAVTEVSSAVTTNELGQVKLTDGTSLAAEWTNVPDLGCRYSATVQVFGEGTLTVRFDGEPVGSPIAATDDPVVVSMTAVEGEAKHRFQFSFTGAGHAVVGGFSGPSAGVLLLVR